MGYYVAQADNLLRSVGVDGSVTLLTLPSGILIDTTKRLRAAVLGKAIVLVNSPSRNLWIDRFGTLRELAITPPPTQPTLTAVAGGTLVGAYLAKFTYLLIDPVSRVAVAESDFSPVSTQATPATQQLQVGNIGVSARADINGRRFYRTASGPGEEYFKWFDLPGNNFAVSTFTDGRSDDSLGVLSAPDDLGTPPGRFSLIVQWKDRLFAVPTTDIDTVHYTANRKHYAWPAVNTLPIKPLGADSVGVSGFLPRRDELGIARRDLIYKVIGDPPNISLVKLVEGVGVEAPDSVQVIRDIAFWLAKDGVYMWGPGGVSCVSDESSVRAWFTTDTYFNRARFQYAIARYNEKLHAYELHLAAAGSSNEDRWVTYYIDQKRWLGPHRTAAFTPSVAALLRDSNGVALPVIGDTSGYLWKVTESTTPSDDTATAIDFDVTLRHNCGTPDIDKEFLQLSMLTQIQVAGSLIITPALGRVDASDQSSITHDLTTGRERLRRISTYAQGVGKNLKLRFRQNSAAQDVVIYGYEIPWFEAGRR